MSEQQVPSQSEIRPPKTEASSPRSGQHHPEAKKPLDAQSDSLHRLISEGLHQRGNEDAILKKIAEPPDVSFDAIKAGIREGIAKGKKYTLDGTLTDESGKAEQPQEALDGSSR